MCTQTYTDGRLDVVYAALGQLRNMHQASNTALQFHERTIGRYGFNSAGKDDLFLHRFIPEYGQTARVM
jgi:hypothetical protein